MSSPVEHGENLPPEAADLAGRAIAVLKRAATGKVSIVTAESCTGGLLASLLTDQRGLGKWFDRGFVVYTEKAKTEMLGIDPVEIVRHGVVSPEIAGRMAEQALARSDAGLAVGITGFAGPAGPGDETGLVHLNVCAATGASISRTCRFGDVGRDRTRALAAEAALEMLEEALDGRGNRP
ncbi:CinA family protein [Novosphingobium tardum]|uniref:CinA family protein n=1 Tax=Novosphingobium tardum TaxID=1538021 RepID=A0ABV8RTV8_9SPHN